MKASIQARLEGVSERHEEIAALLGDPEVINDQNRFRDLSREYSQLEPVVKTFQDYQKTQADRLGAEEMLRESDAEMREMAQEELDQASSQLAVLESQLQTLLLPKDPRDEYNAFLEIRAGTGGR